MAPVATDAARKSRREGALLAEMRRGAARTEGACAGANAVAVSAAATRQMALNCHEESILAYASAATSLSKRFPASASPPDPSPQRRRRGERRGMVGKREGRKGGPVAVKRPDAGRGPSLSPPSRSPASSEASDSAQDEGGGEGIVDEWEVKRSESWESRMRGGQDGLVSLASCSDTPSGSLASLTGWGRPPGGGQKETRADAAGGPDVDPKEEQVSITVRGGMQGLDEMVDMVTVRPSSSSSSPLPASQRMTYLPPIPPRQSGLVRTASDTCSSVTEAFHSVGHTMTSSLES